MAGRSKQNFNNDLIGHLAKGLIDQQKAIKELQDEVRTKQNTAQTNNQNWFVNIFEKHPLAACITSIAASWIMLCGVFAFLTNRWDNQHSAEINRQRQTYESQLAWARERELHLSNISERECRLSVEDYKSKLRKCEEAERNSASNKQRDL